ncbi:MAG: VWA domain-containing protein [Lachnospiraceae bacterium]|nr:VWA domain-containing protein [Lachnospiraceae bacterium]
MKKRFLLSSIMIGMLCMTGCRSADSGTTAMEAPASEACAEPAGAFDMATGDAVTMESAEVAGESMTVPSTQGVGTQQQQQGQTGILTAAYWNDLENWDFFTNLVGQKTISFPSYGLDPTRRVAVNVKDGNGDPLENESVALLDAQGNELWTTLSDADGNAYLFYAEDAEPAEVKVNGESQEFAEEMSFVTEASAAPVSGLQCMFILDTTGSMGDELNYLTEDFSAIVADVGGSNVLYSANFYRDFEDDYVTRCNPFTNDTDLVQDQFAAEKAAGGGDFPEAVADVLREITTQANWKDGYRKIAFLIFDAPPHEEKADMVAKAVATAAEKGIHIIPVVASNADRDTELFGRAVAISTNADYVFLTDDSGVGDSHLEPIVGAYQVELLHDLIVREIQSYIP